MKRFHILILIFALTLTPLFGSASESTAHIDSIAAKIQSTITLPESCKSEDDQRVFVVFSIAGNGAVTVHEVGTANSELKTSIVGQFQSMHFDNAEQQYDGTYSIWLNFKTL